MELIVTDTRVKNKYTDQVIVATNKPDIFRKEERASSLIVESLQGDEWVQPESVWKLVEQYNGCLKFLPDDIRWMFEEGTHIEGSGIAQAFSDIILLIHIYKRIFDRYNIGEVRLFVSETNIMECTVVSNMAHNRHIKVKLHYDGCISYFKAMMTPASRWIMSLCMMAKRFKELLFLRSKAKHQMPKQKRSYDVGVYIGSNSIKHYNWSLALIKEIQAKIDNYCIITPDKGDTYNHCKADGYQVVDLEDYIDRKAVDYLEKIYIMNKKKYQRMLLDKTWLCEDEDISECVYRQIMISSCWRLANRFALFVKIKSFLETTDLRYLRVHGDWYFPHNQAFFAFSREYGTKLCRVDGNPSECFPENYSGANIMAIRYVCAGHPIISEMKDAGYNGEFVFLSRDSFRTKGVREYQPIIPDCKKIKILWAPSNVIRGYGSKEVFNQHNFQMFTEAIKRRNVQLFAKYHPNQDVREIEQYISMYKDVTFLDKSEAIENCISMVDIVVTDTSSLIENALWIGKPIVAVIQNENEKRFISNVIDYIQTYDSVENFYKDLDCNCVSDTQLTVWLNSLRNKQEGYYSDAMLGVCGCTSEEIIANDLKKRLMQCENE